MENYNVIGIQKVDFTDRTTGNKIVGLSVYYTQPIGDMGVGEKSGKFFISNDKISQYDKLDVGVSYEFYFNQKGKVSAWKKA